MTQHRPWSQEDTDRLRALWPKVGPTSIAYKLGRTRDAILKKARKIGLGPSPFFRAKQRKWTEREELHLRLNWGKKSTGTIAHTLGRTKRAVGAKAKELGIGKAYQGQGHVSITDFAKTSGFSKTKIKHTADVLGIKLKRGYRSYNHGRSYYYSITPQEQERILQHMLNNAAVFRDRPGDAHTTRGRWGVGRKPPCCVECGTTDRPHASKGFCSTCYRRKFRTSPRKRTLDHRYKIRPMQKKDMDAVRKIGEGWVARRGSKRQLEDLLTAGFPALVATFDKRVIGYVVGEQRGGQIWITSVCVGENHRGRGVGEKLMRAVMEKGKYIMLQHRVDNVPATALYNKLGFGTHGRLPNYYGDGVDGYARTIQTDSSG